MIYDQSIKDSPIMLYLQITLFIQPCICYEYMYLLFSMMTSGQVVAPIEAGL